MTAQTTVARLKGSLHDRVSALETRAEKHDGMAAKIDEIYDAWTKLKNINWFVWKVGGAAAAGLGLVAVVLTIASNASHLIGH